MESFNINVQKRTLAQKSEIRKLKGQGFVPGILYNANQNIPLSVEESEINYILAKHGDEVLINLNYDGKPVTAKIQQIQRDPVSHDVKHIDFKPVKNYQLH